MRNKKMNTVTHGGKLLPVKDEWGWKVIAIQWSGAPSTQDNNLK